MKPAQPQRRPVEPGYDGKTLGERLRVAMGAQAPIMRETDLLAACREVTRIGGQDLDPPLVSQQLLNLILRNEVGRSAVTPIVAEVCGVRAVWLQFGIGPMRDEAPNGRGAMNHSDRADKAFMEAFRELPRDWEFTIRGIVSTLAVAMRESHGEFARHAKAATRQLLQDNNSPLEEFDRET